MRLPTYAVLTILALLYIVAAYTRIHGTGEQRSPYFPGASAMIYRDASLVADGKPLDATDTKAGWPGGYRPAAYRASGVEVVLGYALRASRYFSDVDGHVFTARLFALLFSLCVFTMYAFVRRLWNCQAAGLIAAGFVAAFAPLVSATNGRHPDHTSVAVLLVTVHALALLRAYRGRSRASGVFAALVAFFILAAWEPALYYAAALSCAMAFAPWPDDGSRRWTLFAHTAAVVVASVALPYLGALRALASWPALLAVATAGSEFFPARYRGGGRRALAIAAVTLALVVLATPVRRGAAESVPVLQYVWLRLRYLAARPASSTLLPDSIRGLWSVDHAPPSAHMLLMFFLPVAFLVAAAAMSARERLRRHRKAIVASLFVAAAGAVAYAVDRSAATASAVAVVPLLSMSGISISGAVRTRGALVALGAYVMLAQTFYPLSAGNPTFQIARNGGFAYHDPNHFLWVSMTDTDKELVRFVATHTAVADAFLGNDDVSAILLTFAGRTSVSLPGAVTRDACARNAALAHAFYEDENSLYETCRREHISYVLYSIDMLLDQTRYSPRYLAGAPAVTDESMVNRMNFDPESLQQFTLVYENEHYRLYRVTQKPETIFITDHPPVYQREVFDLAGGDIDAFRQRLVDLLLTYRQARVEAEHGDYDDALKKLDWCVAKAPHYTRARIAIGTTLTQAGRYKEARDALLGVVADAPDNAEALYHTAYALAALGESDRAHQYLDLFFSVATDTDLIEKARLLKTFIDQGIPVTPGSMSQQKSQ